MNDQATKQTSVSDGSVKVTRRGIKADYEGKMSFKDRMIIRLTSSAFWIDRVWYIFRFILMVGISFVILYPFLSKILTSFMASTDFGDPTVSLVPKHFSVEIYRQLATDKKYLNILLNTTLLSGVSALLQTFVACMVGYGLAKFRFKGNKLIFLLVIITMAIPHNTLQLSMSEHFIQFDVLSIYSIEWWKGPIELITGKGLPMQDTFWPFIVLSITGLAFKNGLYIFMMRQFFQGVPDELEESAYVDGSGTFRTFFRIILPLSVPMMITIFLFAFSWQWTDSFYTNLFFVNNKPPLMPSLIDNNVPKYLITLGNEIGAANAGFYTAIKNAGGLMIIAPLVIVYLFCQRYLVEGIERSGITG